MQKGVHRSIPSTRCINFKAQNSTLRTTPSMSIHRIRTLLKSGRAASRRMSRTSRASFNRIRLTRLTSSTTLPAMTTWPTRWLWFRMRTSRRVMNTSLKETAQLNLEGFLRSIRDEINNLRSSRLSQSRMYSRTSNRFRPSRTMTNLRSPQWRKGLQISTSRSNWSRNNRIKQKATDAPNSDSESAS